MWFENLVGFNEITPEQVRANLRIEGDQLISIANSKSYTYGKLEVLSLAELKDRAKSLDAYQAKIQFSEKKDKYKY